MRDDRPSNAWLRMTDTMGLTDPDRKPELPRPRLLLFLAVLWSLMSVNWLVQLIREISRGPSDFLILNIISVAVSIPVAVYYVVSWRRAKREQTDAVQRTGPV